MMMCVTFLIAMSFSKITLAIRVDNIPTRGSFGKAGK